MFDVKICLMSYVIMSYGKICLMFEIQGGYKMQNMQKH